MASTSEKPYGGEFEPGELVRVFSLDIKSKYEGNPAMESEIESSIVEDLDIKEKRRKKRIREIEEYLESTMSHELVALNRTRQSLELAVQDFCACIQKSGSTDLSLKLESWQDVIVVVEEMKNRLERKQEKGKFRRVTKGLRTFCNTVQAHSTPLKMLPSSNQYVSVFYGALATVIQASENYTRIMEALPKALIDINDAVSAIEKRLWLFENQAMKSYAWRLYTQIFSFLVNILRWYTKRSYQRLISSFNEHLPEFFEDQVDEIRKSAELIHQEAHLRSQADAQISRLYLEGFNGKFDKLIVDLREMDQRNRNTEQRYEKFFEMMDEMRRHKLQDGPALQDALHEICTKIVRGETGHAVSEILEGDAREQNALRRYDPKRSRKRAEHDETSQETKSRSIDQPMVGTIKSHDYDTTRDTILSYSASLESFFSRLQVQPDVEPHTNFLADPTAIACVQEWAVAVESKVLYITGEDSLSDDSSIPGIAKQYSSVARETGLPVCSYFCNLTSEDPPEGRTRETIELVALVYSLIRQLIELLPSRILWGEVHLDEDLFNALEGTLNTFPTALEILDILLSSTGHTIVILVIDGVDKLDDFTFRSSEKCLQQFMEILLKHLAQKEGPIAKILFTSTGTSAPLFELLDSRDILVINPLPKRQGRQSGGEQFSLY